MHLPLLNVLAVCFHSCPFVLLVFIFIRWKVFLNSNGSLKLGCLAQAMMVNPTKDSGNAGAAGAKGDGQGDADMDVEVIGNRGGRKTRRPRISVLSDTDDAIFSVEVRAGLECRNVCCCCAQRNLVREPSDAPANCRLCLASLQETSAGRKAAHKESKLKLKKEKLARENASKKVSWPIRDRPCGNDAFP